MIFRSDLVIIQSHVN